MASENNKRRRRLRICLSVDFDAVSGYLGTGYDPKNTLADFSAGIFSANVGVGRLLTLFKKHGISDKVSWYVPGHSLETFPTQAKAIAESGAEIGLHGYSHEGAYAMTVEQEEDVLKKCIELATVLRGGTRPVGYRAPLYQIRETTVRLLQKYEFSYDTSMNAHDSLPYFLPNPFLGEPPLAPDYQQKAETWMKPAVIPAQPVRGTAEAQKALVEIPGSCVDVVEKMWWDRFDWIWENESWLDDGPGKDYGSIFPMIWHPESAGRAHVVGMIDKFIGKLNEKMKTADSGEITFETGEAIASSWRQSAGSG
ncbi:Peptidoglycan deacetylase [Cyphellophora attinorum]|uniref:Peptidoglycan deacetylase n=1 Tax=Cyphellophora attinorum TaxID=1664694 RepID=A0A0N1P0Z6_9EURO|nr:Peptidoglycan deacetylase [Phialophora attinorum]KPI41315.1 Peptidoglycan deacetylase [Phialophora attinorum]